MANAEIMNVLQPRVSLITRSSRQRVPAAVARAIVETAGDKFQSIGIEGGQVAELGLACYKSGENDAL